jgi:hypothetical protein
MPHFSPGWEPEQEATTMAKRGERFTVKRILILHLCVVGFLTLWQGQGLASRRLVIQPPPSHFELALPNFEPTKVRTDGRDVVVTSASRSDGAGTQNVHGEEGLDAPDTESNEQVYSIAKRGLSGTVIQDMLVSATTSRHPLVLMHHHFPAPVDKITVPHQFLLMISLLVDGTWLGAIAKSHIRRGVSAIAGGCNLPETPGSTLGTHPQHWATGRDQVFLSHGE